MIRFLAIRHLAVIDALELELPAGLTVLTGETGAGKSILVGAVGLLLGGRASPDLVRTGEDAASIQAIFETPDGRELVVRREVSAQGRSRAFIDDALVTTGALRGACGGLVDLHGQHEHQLLLDPGSHLDLLDEFAGLETPRQAVAAAYEVWRSCRERLDRARTEDRDRQARSQLAAFQLDEIERAAPQPGEDDRLATARTVLASAEKLQRLCAEGYDALYEGEGAVLAGLGGVWRRVGELAALDPTFAPYAEAREDIKSQLEDLAFFLRSYAADIDASPERLQEVEDRLALLERLKRKHGPTLADVLDTQARLRREADDLTGAADRAAALAEAADAARAEYLRRARALSEARRTAAGDFALTLERLLADLAMERTRCEVRFSPPAGEGAEGEWTARGVDRGEFYLSPNPGEDLRPLARIASGGELSRVMLALRTLASTDAPGKTLVFDEVDAGIGGRAADMVGRRLQQLGGRFQVLCITHLPQIAACGSAHVHIAKSVRRGRTVTTVERLDGPAREAELARMIAGADVSDAMLAGARALLASRGTAGKRNTKGESERAKAKGRRLGQ